MAGKYLTPRKNTPGCRPKGGDPIREKRRTIITISLAVLLFLLALGLTVYPIFSSRYNDAHQSQIHTEYQDAVNALPDTAIPEARAAAQSYNEELWSSIVQYGSYSKDSVTSAMEEYAGLLDLTGTGTMGYVHIKALCSGNPQIKEKTDLDIEVQKLKLLRSNHMSQRYALEDKLIHSFPMQIASTRQMIDGLQSDMVLLKENTHPNETGFSPMVIDGHIFTEKKAAGTALLDACNALTGTDPIPLGSYRGFQMTLCFDSFEKLFKISVQGALTYKVGLGADVFGNIQRMDNLLESMPTRQIEYKEKLKNLEIQVENAKQEVAKPFPRENELKEKSARLDQLNILLNMDKRENEIMGGAQDEGEIQPQKESRDLER